MDTGYSKWRKLDNAALAFPLVTGKNDTRVFRFYCQLKEEVNGEILQGSTGSDNGEISIVPGGSEKRAVLVLSGAQRYQSSGKAGDGTAMQPFIYSG